MANVFNNAAESISVFDQSVKSVALRSGVQCYDDATHDWGSGYSLIQVLIVYNLLFL